MAATTSLKKKRISSPGMRASVSLPSGDGGVMLEVIQVKMGEKGGNVWLGCGKALL